MKVIQGAFGGKKQDTDRISVPEVFKLIMDNEDLENYDDAFCIIKSESTSWFQLTWTRTN
jgi:hypothetical protein